MRRPDLAAKLPKIPFAVLIALCAALLAVATILPDYHGTPLQAAVTASLCLPVLLAGLLCTAETGPIARLFLVLGNASYAIYLFHPHFVSAMLGVWHKLAPGTPVAIVVTGVTLLAIAVGIAIHYALERPLVRFAGRTLGRHRSTTT